MKRFKEDELLKLKYGQIELLVKKKEAFIFYATFIANEYKNLKIKKMI